MKKEYEKTRIELLNSIKSEKIRSIISSQFYATPQFEDIYYERIKDCSEYLDIYKRWVLSQDPLLSVPDEDLYKLRSGVIQLPQNENSEVIRYERKLLFFFIDLLYLSIDRSVKKALNYYTLKDENITLEQIEKAVEETVVDALNLSDKDFIEKAGYPSLGIAFMDMFKVVFSQKIGSIFVTLPDDKINFIKSFESEWEKLHNYSDSLYGFDVIPKLLPQDIFRYLKIPFEDTKYLELRKTDMYKQSMNYIVSFASSFKPLPDPRLRVYFRNELTELFRPLVKKLIGVSIKDGSFTLKDHKQELEDSLVKEIPEMISEFNFFFATQENLKKKKISPFEKLIFVIRGQIVKIGNNVDSDEYPLTDYLSKKIKSRIREYLDVDKSGSGLSLDEGINGFNLSDTLSDEQNSSNNHIPEYDAKDKSGSLMGWKINTFCGIINKGSSTLRRWDKEDLLKPKRYTIGNKGYQTPYRAYTREDLIKARKIDEMLKKKSKHQS